MSAWLLHPVPGAPVSQRFGVNRKWYPPFRLRNGQMWPGGHEGLDFACVKGTPVFAGHDGLVMSVTRTIAPLRALQPPYGRHVRIEFVHDGRKVTLIYAHLDRLDEWMKPGAVVVAGQRIGWSGNTGRVLSEPGWHLHFGVNVDDYPVNPELMIAGGVA